MNLSKDFAKIESRFAELIQENKKNISDIENEIAQVEKKKAAGDERAAAAASAGDETAYREAITSKQFNEGRLKYLSERLKSLKDEPLTDQAEAGKMLSVIEEERERLEEYIYGGFLKKYAELIEESEDLIFNYTLTKRAEALMHSAIMKDNETYSSFFLEGPQMLVNIRRNACLIADKLPGVKAGPGAPRTEKQIAEQGARLEKWEV